MVWLCLLFLLLPPPAAAGPSVPVYMMHVQETTGGREIAKIPVNRGDPFRIEYMHSMYKVKQCEFFRVGSDSRFDLEKVTFGSFAAADYYAAERRQRYTVENGIWVTHVTGKHYSILKFRIGPNSGHVLYIGDRRLDLSGILKDPGGRIEIFLKKN